MTRSRAVALIAVLLSLVASAGPARSAPNDPPAKADLSRSVAGAPDWAAVNREALGYFQTYLRFNTTNPPGDTSAAVAFLNEILDREGIETQTFESKPGMVNLVARLPGPPGKKPLLLLSHADVVPAAAADWSHPPFEARLDHGYVWGRGAIDDKAHGIMALMTMIELKRLKVPLRRSVEMMVNADEEVGGRNGALFMVANHFAAVDPAFVINEGGRGTPKWLGSRGTTFRVAVSEKRVMWMRLTVRGRSGHGSVPTPDNPNLILIHALARLIAEQPPIRLTPVFREAMEEIAGRMAFPASFELAHLNWPLMTSIALRGPLDASAVRAVMRDTIVPTTLDSGLKVNVIPSEAQAGLDCRLLPGTDEAEFLKRMRRRLGDRRIEIELIQKPDNAPPSPASGEAWRAIKAVVGRVFKDSVVIPWMTSGGTDSRFFRARGVPSYGLAPVILGPREARRVHGVDERLSVRNLERGIRATYALAIELCADRSGRQRQTRRPPKPPRQR